MVSQEQDVWQLLIVKNQKFKMLNDSLTQTQREKFWAINSSDISYYIFQHECQNITSNASCFSAPKLTPEFITNDDGKIIDCCFRYNFCSHYIKKIQSQTKARYLLLDQSKNYNHNLNPNTETAGINKLIKMLFSNSAPKIEHVISPGTQTLASRLRNFFGEVTRLIIEKAASLNLEIVVLQTIILQQQFRNSFNELGKQIINQIEYKIAKAKVIIIHGIGDEMFSYSWVQYFCRTILWNESHGKEVKIIFLTKYSAVKLCKNYFNYFIERGKNSSQIKYEAQTIKKQIHWFASYLFDRYNYNACVYRYVLNDETHPSTAKFVWTRLTK